MLSKVSIRRAMMLSRSRRGAPARYYTARRPRKESGRPIAGIPRKAPTWPRGQPRRSAQAPARHGQIDAALSKDQRHITGDGDRYQRARKNVAEIMRPDHDAAQGYDRCRQNIKQEMPRPETPEGGHQRDDRRAVPRWERPMVRTPAEPSKIIDVRAEQELWPGSAKTDLQDIGGDARGCDRAKQKRRNRRESAHRDDEVPQPRR